MCEGGRERAAEEVEGHCGFEGGNGGVEVAGGVWRGGLVLGLRVKVG